MRIPAVIAGRGVSALSRILRLGSGLTYPGLVAERLHPHIVRDLARSLPAGSVVVTGTNGKTTTTKMIGDTLAAAGFGVVHNDSGSNLRQGIASTLVNGVRLLGGRGRPGIAVLEVDEATMPLVAADIAPRVICVTNLLRDQLDRYGELDTILDLVGKGVADAAPPVLLLNADDPVVARLARHVPGSVAWFGIADPTCAGPAAGRDRTAAHCPECGGPLEFATGHYAHLGDWRCRVCGNARPVLDYMATDVILGPESSAFTLVSRDVRVRIELPVPGLHNVYNAVAAAACAMRTGVSPDAVARSLAAFSAAFGRSEELDVDGHRVVLVLAKNPTGVQQALASVLGSGGPKTIGIALNDNIADGTDVSWIWDVDFEALDMSACTVVLTGGRAEDLALRLKYAGVGGRNVRVCHDPIEAVGTLGRLAPGRSRAHMIATYTAMLEIRTSFAPAHDRFAALGRSLHADA